MGGLLAAGQHYAVGCAWNFGGLCLGGSLDGQGLSHTHLGLRLGSELLAGPEASRRHVASRRAEGLGLRLVSGWTLRPGLLDDLGPDTSQGLVSLAWAELLGQPDWGAGARPVSDT